MMKKIIALTLIVAIAYAGFAADCASAVSPKGNTVITSTPLFGKYIAQCHAFQTGASTGQTCAYSGKVSNAITIVGTSRVGCIADPCDSVVTTANAGETACLAVTTFYCYYDSTLADTSIAVAKCKQATCAQHCGSCQNASTTAADTLAGQGATCTAAASTLGCGYTLSDEGTTTWPCVGVCANTANGCTGCMTATNQIAIGSAGYDAAMATMGTACETAGCAYTVRTTTVRASCQLGDCLAASVKIACGKCLLIADCQLATKGRLNENCAWDTAVGSTACKIGDCGISTSTKFACGMCSASDCVLATKGGIATRLCVEVAAVTATKQPRQCRRGDCGTSTSTKFKCEACTTTADCTSQTKGNYAPTAGLPTRKCGWDTTVTASCKLGDCGLSTSTKFTCNACTTSADCISVTKGMYGTRGCLWVTATGCRAPAPASTSTAAASFGFVKGLPVLSMIILAICLLAEF